MRIIFLFCLALSLFGCASVDKSLDDSEPKASSGGQNLSVNNADATKEKINEAYRHVYACLDSSINRVDDGRSSEKLIASVASVQCDAHARHFFEIYSTQFVADMRPLIMSGYRDEVEHLASRMVVQKRNSTSRNSR